MSIVRRVTADPDLPWPNPTDFACHWNPLSLLLKGVYQIDTQREKKRKRARDIERERESENKVIPSRNKYCSIFFLNFICAVKITKRLLSQKEADEEALSHVKKSDQCRFFNPSLSLFWNHSLFHFILFFFIFLFLFLFCFIFLCFSLYIVLIHSVILSVSRILPRKFCFWNRGKKKKKIFSASIFFFFF